MPTQQEAMQRWKIQTRKEAHALGLKHYYTGKPCTNGHNEQRAVASGICTACNRMYATAYRNGGPDRQVTLKLACHPDDAESVRQFVAGLNVSRELAAAVPIAPPDMSATRMAVFPDLVNAPPGYTPPKAVLR